ncbi:protein HEAT INTOLERANT 4 [Magnolia sinica]|uniref:protein HEAT INTOLERANT 4 n=1 Tax=Magnolia sinica TaxID=86752 RepID=UPI002658F187|nr:protein HEAT INTOLERANT 4 [Magnolia sinica]
MRKPKRGSSSSSKRKKEGSSTTSQKQPSKGSTSRGKRVKAPPSQEPEFFPEKRNLEDLWQAAFPVGTEWDQLDSVYKFNWDFSNLENAFEEGGELYGKKVYLFGCTEPQLVFFKNGEGKVICIPVVVAVVSPFPPSDKIGVKSVQRESEEILPMKEMKMAWVPYIPLEDRDSQVDRLKSQIFTMSCTQRRAALRHLKIDRIKKYEYCLPYFYHPMKEDELEQDTVVQIMYPTEPPIVCDFDWELDELEEFVSDKIKDEVLAEDQKDAFKDFIKEKVREAKKAQREAREARKKAVEEMDEETKAAYENMRFYKFYPVQTPDAPDISQVKVPFINRYYGKAHKVL